MRGSMESYPRAAVERAMKVQEVILRAMAKKINWWHDPRCLRAQGEFVEVHMRLRTLPSGALLRGDGREGGPALLNLVTAAVRARSLFRVMLCDGQSLQECFLADELIMGQTNLPSR